LIEPRPRRRHVAYSVRIRLSSWELLRLQLGLSISKMPAGARQRRTSWPDKERTTIDVAVNVEGEQIQ
jgi:hypothetical protein